LNDGKNSSLPIAGTGFPSSSIPSPVPSPSSPDPSPTITPQVTASSTHNATSILPVTSSNQGVFTIINSSADRKLKHRVVLMVVQLLIVSLYFVNI